LTSRAELVIEQWYRAEDGADHFGAACMRCGAVHDCIGSLMAVIPFVGESFKALGFVRAEEFVERHQMAGAGKTFFSYAIEEIGLPRRIVRHLEDAGHFPEREITGAEPGEVRLLRRPKKPGGEAD